MMYCFAFLSEDSQLVSMIKKCFCKYKNIHVTYYDDPYTLLEQMTIFEAVFIDCQMVKMNYLTFLEAVHDSECLKIVVSDHSYIHIESVVYHIFYYMRKHCLIDDFFVCLKKVMNQLTSYKQQKLVLVLKKQIISLFYDDIIYMETNKNYIIIHAYKDYKIRMTFKKLLSLVNCEHFVTISYGVIVNIKYVSFVDFKKMCVVLENQKILSISRRYQKAVKEKCQYFLYLPLLK